MSEVPYQSNKRKLSVKYDYNISKKSTYDISNNPPMDNNKSDLSALFNDDFSMSEFTDLDLTVWHRCIIDAIESQSNEKVLKLTKENSSSKAVCYVRGNWQYLKFKPGDVISIRAVWDNKLNNFLVSLEHGFIIQNPDNLISGTSVVGSLFCLRRGILSDKFKGIDSGNKIMIIGSLIHELFQLAIKKKIKSNDEILSISENLLNSKSTIFSLYSNNMSLTETRQDFQNYIPNIQNFMKRYIDTNSMHRFTDENFSGKIDSIIDIEENIWIPKLGLKGKIDVTVSTIMNQGKSQITPLEIKTGKTSFSMEHKGQLGLYQIMLSELNYAVDSGLLLYLKEGVMREVSINRNEQRDLLMLRNEITHFLTQDTKYVNNKFHTELPEPINHHNACFKCPYNVICCAYMTRDQQLKLSDKHPLKVLSPNILKHLTEKDIDYFITWSGLMSLEHQQSRKDSSIKHIWTKKIEERELSGGGIGFLKLENDVNEIENSYLHIFTRNEKSRGLIDFTSLNFNTNDYVIISVSKRIAVAAGFIQKITKSYITLLLERDLSLRYKKEQFRIDSYTSESISSFNLTNLGCLLDDTETSNRLRKIIIEKPGSEFDKSLPKQIATDGSDILKKLNSIQRRAVLKAIATQNYLLLKGLPGTGKTQTLVALVQILVLLRKSVLITSHTHSAVDNLLLRLKDVGIQFLRLGSNSRINSNLHEFSESNITENCKTPSELEEYYNRFQVVGVTCQGSAHVLLTKRQFDICIVDESTQVFQLAVIRPLLSARKFILVGDPDQLPPIVRSLQARQMGADESLFARLDSEQSTFTLSLQYRMNKTITNIANKLTYKGSLKCANTELENASLSIPNAGIIMKNYSNDKWLLKSLSSHIDQAVVIINTGNVFQRSTEYENQQKNMPLILVNIENLSNQQSLNKKNSIYVNFCEVSIIIYIINALLIAGVKGNAIGIIAPFRSQVELLSNYIKKFQEDFYNENNLELLDDCKIEVNTVDQYQGRDKQLIIYSCTKSINTTKKSDQAESAENEILNDQRRLTVAITRAKHKLILVGDVSSLTRYSPFISLFESISKMNKIDLVEGRMGFSWDRVLNHLETVLEARNDSIIDQMQE